MNKMSEFIFPMTADGTVIFFNSRTPTNHELANCPHITMSSAAEWNPREIQFPSIDYHGEEGQQYGSISGSISQIKVNMATYFDMSICNFDARSISCIVTDRLLATVPIDGSETSIPDVPLPKTFATTKRHSAVTAQELSERWFIGLTQAHETI